MSCVGRPSLGLPSFTTQLIVVFCLCLPRLIWVLRCSESLIIRIFLCIVTTQEICCKFVVFTTPFEFFEFFVNFYMYPQEWCFVEL